MAVDDTGHEAARLTAHIDALRETAQAAGQRFWSLDEEELLAGLSAATPRLPPGGRQSRGKRPVSFGGSTRRV
jgi:hypothetical protein